MLHQKIKEEIKQAMLVKDQLKLDVVRGLVAAFTNELVAKRRKPDGQLTDDEAVAVIRRGVKQRQDSIEQFRAGGRDDLADQESAELKILKTYLLPEISEEEIEKLVKAKIKELGVTDRTGAGKLTGIMMKDLKGQADGAVVKRIVENYLIS